MDHTRKHTVLISGLGVAGATLAWWLARAGFAVTVVEEAEAPRSGGYMIDFWGLGYEVAERMGILERLRARAYPIDELRLMRADGQALAVVGGASVRAMMGERFFSIPRGDLARELADCALAAANVRYADRICAMHKTESGVTVLFDAAPRGVFDIVVGADGLHSPTRQAIFAESCEHDLGYWTAAFTVEDYPHRDPGAYVSFTEVGRQVARYSLNDGATTFFFFFRAPDGMDRPPQGVAARRAVLRSVYGRDWECAEILASLQDSDEIYFDKVAQVQAPGWSRGRVALVGDAAYCPSLLAGEGASFAMAGAYVLAAELARTPSDPAAAFTRYEAQLRPFISRKQRSARWMAGWFAPKSATGLWARNMLTRLAAHPTFGRLLLGGMLRDDLALPS